MIFPRLLLYTADETNNKIRIKAEVYIRNVKNKNKKVTRSYYSHEVDRIKRTRGIRDENFKRFCLLIS